MAPLGRAVLLLIRTFHYWHKQHLKVSLTLAAIGLLVSVAGWETRSNPLWRVPAIAGHVIHAGTLLFFALYLLLILLGRIAARRWPPPVVRMMTGLPRPVEAPSTGHWVFGDSVGCRYRFRYATDDDMETFVRFSIADPAILLTYAYLDPAGWARLYRRWHELSDATCAVLERQISATHDWSVVAVSIVLPLSRQAARRLGSGEIGVIDIDADELAFDKKATVYLLDLLAVDRRASNMPQAMVWALPKIHLAHFFDPWPRRQMEIWVEPVHRKLPRIVKAMGFEGPHPTPRHQFYSLVLPLRGSYYTLRQKCTASALQGDIHEAAGWPLL